MRRYVVLACLCVVLAVGGCGTESGPTLVPATGTVTLDGAPLSGAEIVFYGTMPAKDGQPAREIQSAAVTGADGSFELKDVHSGLLGAAPGPQKVTVSKLVLKDGSPVPPDADLAILGPNMKQMVPLPYTQVLETPLTADVPPAGGVVNLDLKSELPKTSTP